MATNKELNDKVDKLTVMFETMMLAQSANNISTVTVTKKRGRPSKKDLEPTNIEDYEQEPVNIRRRGRAWNNNFVDDGNEHTEDKKIDKLLQVKPPTEKGIRKNPMITSVCTECSKTEKIHRQFTFEGHHTCQKCLKNKVGK